MKKRSVLALAVGSVCVLSLTAGNARPSAQSAGPTFSKDVAPIFYANCTSCHRPGEIAPMSLLTYQDARPWARAIATAVARGSMPPWHADPAHGQFVNDRRLTDADKDTIVQWATNGAAEGEAKDLAPQPTYASGWTLGQPDAVFSMLEDYPVPAEGAVAYKYFEIPTTFTEDKWIQAMEVRAGNPAVVHHVIVYARAPQAPPRSTPLFKFPEGTNDIPAGQTGGPALPPEEQKLRTPNDRPAPRRIGSAVGGFAPGQQVRIYQDGTAMRLPAGATMIFQMHYTANGTATTDRTRIGVRFAKEAPRAEVRFTALVNGGLHIPAGASDHRVDTEMTMLQNVTVWSMLPHTHVRGKRWTYEATYPDGRTETILAVPTYDFNWQTDYVFKQPLKLPKGTKLHATAWYDNSPANKSNPDPTKDVWWGDQTWEEMMFTGISFSVDSAPAAPTAGAQP